MFVLIRVVFGLVVAEFDSDDAVSILAVTEMSLPAFHPLRLPHLCSVPSRVLGLRGRM